MATGSFTSPNYPSSQSEVLRDHYTMNALDTHECFAALRTSKGFWSWQTQRTVCSLSHQFDEGDSEESHERSKFFKQQRKPAYGDPLGMDYGAGSPSSFP
ncbi:hypothetical protein TNCV_3545921 [Trichonephila clavipes]|nr:hypothetical protein TNCV_3545921 [Trichonephila clavipes]